MYIWVKVRPRVGVGFLSQSRVGSGQDNVFARSGRVQEMWPVDNSEVPGLAGFFTHTVYRVLVMSEKDL